MIKILLIEDNQDHQELIKDQICEGYGYDVQFEVSTTLAGGIDLLSQQQFDLILFDLNLPDSNVKNTVKELKQLRLDTAVIALTSLNDLNLAKSLLANGIQDYLTKDDLAPTMIHKSFTYAIERKHFEKTLQDEVEEKEAFCYTLSHDFRGPIRRIGSFIKQMEGDEKNNFSDRGKESLHFIQTQCNQIQTLIQELESYISLGINDASFEAVNLNEITEQVIKANADLIQAKAVQIKIKPLITIIGLKPKLYLLFENLILNAIKHNDKIPEINIVALSQSNSIRIEIKDNGPGIEEFFIKQIFIPFKKKHNSTELVGSGLGLAIAKKIVNQHQGKIGVHSTLDKGSTFFIDFPEKVIIK